MNEEELDVKYLSRQVSCTILVLTEFAALMETSSGTGEVEASHFEERVERIILGHFNGEASGVTGFGLGVATPGLGIGGRICVSALFF